MIEDLERIEPTSKESQIEGLNPSQESYLKELNVSGETWVSMCPESQQETFDLINARMDELGIDNGDKQSCLEKYFSPEIVETYKQIEAPQDYIQIEEISDVLANCEDLRYENWANLELCEKEAVLNKLEEKIASIEHRPPCQVSLTPMREGLWGGYNPNTKSIEMNSNYAGLEDYGMYREVIDTLVHEGRHAYQDYNVNVCETHPRHSEVASWAETMEGGKWPYWNDCSTVLGQRLYEQQSIEIDARNFAADVLEKMDLKA